MKKQLILVLLFLPSFMIAQEMNIITFNIRYSTPTDGVNAWTNRVEMVSELLQFHDADIFGLQEALHEQIKDLEKHLPDHKWFGVGRDDGALEGEFCPIFYNYKRFELKSSGQFWLAENCDNPEFGWDAACKRLATWGIFVEKESRKSFLLLNTHFDHRGVEARKNSAYLIQKKIEELTQGKDLAAFLLGDLNLTPDTEPIALIKTFMKDSREISKANPYGPTGTFSGFKWDSPLENRIDYIFVDGPVDILKYAVLSDSKENRYPSDHLPVFVKAKLR